MKNTLKVSNGGMEAAVSNARGLKYAWTRILIPIALVAAIASAACDAGGTGGGTSTSYTVTFSANGGSGTPPAAMTVSAGQSVTLPSGRGLSMSGAAFIGWNASADGSGSNYAAGATFTPGGSITLYANWEVSIYTVTFDANGGSGTTPASRQVPAGYSIPLPDGELSLVYADFIGWNTTADGTGTAYAAGSTYAPAGNIATITLYAQWGNIVPFSSVTGSLNKLDWLEAHAQSNTSYTVEVEADDTWIGGDFSYGNRSGITITLRGIGANPPRTASVAVGSGVTLILDNNITLLGLSLGLSSVVTVDSGGTLIMNHGSAITGGRGGGRTPLGGNTIYYAGGVTVRSGGTFAMNGGEISGTMTDDASYYSVRGANGGGVYVEHGGKFAMHGGTISGNTASSSGKGRRPSRGGGVYVHGIFTMNGGEISGNTAAAFSSGRDTMSSALSAALGGGVYVENGGTFAMHGGEISGNNTASSFDDVNELYAAALGGGVYVSNGGTFTMSGGTISGNTAAAKQPYSGRYSLYGGGVYVADGGRYGFETIIGGPRGTFTKIGGTIYGYSESDSVNSNAVKISSGAIKNNSGHAVYGGTVNSVVLSRETTAGPGVNLSCKGSTFSGGWEF